LVADKVQAALVWYFTTLLPARPNVKKDSWGEKFETQRQCFKTRSGPAGRPGLVAGPGLRKKQVRNWPGQTGSTRDPTSPAKPGWDPDLFIFIFSCSKRRRYGLLQLKGQNNKSRGTNALQNAEQQKWEEDLINFKKLSNPFREEEQMSRRLLNPWSPFQFWA
jgi:hypothetical protein